MDDVSKGLSLKISKINFTYCTGGSEVEVFKTSLVWEGSVILNKTLLF